MFVNCRAELDPAKRREWERPVLAHMNSMLAASGRTVDNLTVKLLKEHLSGRNIQGAEWRPGNKKKDELIVDYRWAGTSPAKLFVRFLVSKPDVHQFLYQSAVRIHLILLHR